MRSGIGGVHVGISHKIQQILGKELNAWGTMWLKHMLWLAGTGLDCFIAIASYWAQSSISLHWSLRMAFLSLLAILWNSAFKWVYLSFCPLLFASLLFSAFCKASSDNHFAFLWCDHSLRARHPGMQTQVGLMNKATSLRTKLVEVMEFQLNYFKYKKRSC